MLTSDYLCDNSGNLLRDIFSEKEEKNNKRKKPVVCLRDYKMIQYDKKRQKKIHRTIVTNSRTVSYVFDKSSDLLLHIFYFDDFLVFYS